MSVTGKAKQDVKCFAHIIKSWKITHPNKPSEYKNSSIVFEFLNEYRQITQLLSNDVISFLILYCNQF